MQNTKLNIFASSEHPTNGLISMFLTNRQYTNRTSNLNPVARPVYLYKKLVLAQFYLKLAAFGVKA